MKIEELMEEYRDGTYFQFNRKSLNVLYILIYTETRYILTMSIILMNLTMTQIVQWRSNTVNHFLFMGKSGD